MNPTDTDLRLRYVLLGAMLADSDIRKEAAARLCIEDAPREVQEAWHCVATGNREGARQWFVGWKVDVWADGILPSLLRTVEERAGGGLCRRKSSCPVGLSTALR